MRIIDDRWVSKDSQSLSLLGAPGEGSLRLRIHASAKSLGICHLVRVRRPEVAECLTVAAHRVQSVVLLPEAGHVE